MSDPFLQQNDSNNLVTISKQRSHYEFFRRWSHDKNHEAFHPWNVNNSVNCFNTLGSQFDKRTHEWPSGQGSFSFGGLKWQNKPTGTISTVINSKQLVSLRQTCARSLMVSMPLGLSLKYNRHENPLIMWCWVIEKIFDTKRKKKPRNRKDAFAIFKVTVPLEDFLSWRY